jgi:hypothetical protein
MPLRPPEVHPEEHLGPIRRFRATGPGVDADEGCALVVLAREEELGPLAGVVRGEGGGVAIQLGRELVVAGLLDERDELDEVVGALREVLPEADLRPEAVGPTEDALGRALVVPETGIEGQRVEFGETTFLDREVKDAPMSP